MTRASKGFNRESVTDKGAVAGIAAMVGGQSLVHGLFVTHVTEAQATIGNRIADFGLLGTFGCVAIGGILRTVDQRRARKEIRQNKLAELKTRLPELADGEDSYVIHKRHAGLKALDDPRLGHNYLPRWFERDAHFRLRTELELYAWLDTLVDKMADDHAACSMIETAIVYDQDAEIEQPFVGSVHTTMTRIENTVGLLNTLVRVVPSDSSISWATLVADRTAHRLDEAARAVDTSDANELVVQSFQRA